jgi:hypothetical protein
MDNLVLVLNLSFTINLNFYNKQWQSKDHKLQITLYLLGGVWKKTNGWFKYV